MIIPEGVTNDELVSALRQALLGRLTFGENIQATNITVSDTGAADTEFTVRHALGKTPTQYIYTINANGVVYDSRRSEWTDQEMYLKCSASNAQVTLTVL